MSPRKVQHWKHGWIPISPEAKAYVAGGWKGPRPGQNHGVGVSFHPADDGWVTTPEQQRELADDIQGVAAHLSAMGDIQVTHSHSSDFMATGRTAGFQVSDMMYDDHIVEGYRRDWAGISLAGSTDSNREFRRVTVNHELGHTIQHRIENQSPEAAKAVNAFLDEPVRPRDLGYNAGSDLDTPKPRWQLDTLGNRSFYANESRYEFFAEALADGMINGDNASDSGKRALALAERYLGGGGA